MPATPQRGDFVHVRTRRWLVEDERSAGEALTALRLACVDDDAQGDVVEVLWDAELDGSVLKDEGCGGGSGRIVFPITSAGTFLWVLGGITAFGVQDQN